MGASVAPVLVALVLFRSVRRARVTTFCAMLVGAGVVLFCQLLGGVKEVGSLVVVWSLDPILVGLPITMLVLIVGTKLETVVSGKVNNN